MKFEIESKYDIGDILVAKILGVPGYTNATNYGEVEVKNIRKANDNSIVYLCELQNFERKWFNESNLEESNEHS